MRSLTLKALFIFSLLFAAGPAAPATDTTNTILVFGDSLAAGYGLRQDASWPALLQQRLDDGRFPYKVANASISGETTRGGLSRLPQALTRFRPAIVILELGANDGLRGLDLGQMRANLEQMIRLAQKQGARVMLIGMKMPPNYGLKYTQGFERVYADLAREYRLPLLPFLFAGFAERRDAFQDDGVHPTAVAQPLMLENVWRTLEPVLKKR